jgi:ferric enterobactin receptor
MTAQTYTDKMKTKITTRILQMVICLTTMSLPIAAQQNNASQGDTVLVTMSAQKQALGHALWLLVEKSNIPLVYNDDLVSAYLVSYSINRQTPEMALQILLARTKLGYQILDNGQYVIVRAKTSGRRNVSGYVEDAYSGERLPYASVGIAGSPYGTAANDDGFFVLAGITDDSLTLYSNYLGYRETKIAVRNEISTEKLVIRMQPKLIAGDSVIVTGDHYSAIQMLDHTSHMQITPTLLYTIPVFGEIDVFRSIQLLPGVSSTSESATSLYLRGGTPSHNLVLFDGITVYQDDHLFGYVSTFNSAVIKDIRVYKGGFPAQFGNRLSGVVEMNGKNGSTKTFKAGATANLLSGSTHFQIPLADNASLLLAYRRSFTDFIRSDLYNEIMASISKATVAPRDDQTTPDFSYSDFTGKLTYLPSQNDLLTISYFGSDDFLDQTREGLVRAQGQPDRKMNIKDITKWNNYGLSAGWSHIFNTVMQSKLLLAHSKYNSLSQIDRIAGAPEFKPYKETNGIANSTVKWHNQWHISAANTFSFGSELVYDRLNLRFTTEDTLKTINKSDKAGQLAFYAQHEWQWGSAISIQPGLRFTYYQLTGKTYADPRFSGYYNLESGLSLKASWGVYHQFINRITNDSPLDGNRDYWLLADDKLPPARAIHTIGGIHYKTEQYLFSIEGFYKDLKDISEFTQVFRQSPDNKDFDLFLTGNGFSRGLEFLWQKQQGNFTGWLAYTMSQVEYTIPEVNRGSAFPANHDRPHELNLVGAYQWGNWTFSSTFELASGAPYSSATLIRQPGEANNVVRPGSRNGERLPNYSRLDVAITRKINYQQWQFSIGISVFNLLDRQNILQRRYSLNGENLVQNDFIGLGFTPTISLSISYK